MNSKPSIRQKRLVGKFPSMEMGGELTADLLQTKLLSGEAHYVGTVSHHGEVHDYYQVDVGGQKTYIYNVR